VDAIAFAALRGDGALPRLAAGHDVRVQLPGKDGRYGLGGYATFFTSRAYRDSLWNTLILGAAVTATSMVVGGALAILVARCRFRSPAGSPRCRW
jgi:ABC-type Fe3+ transport system permease subunit